MLWHELTMPTPVFNRDVKNGTVTVLCGTAMAPFAKEPELTVYVSVLGGVVVAPTGAPFTGVSTAVFTIGVPGGARLASAQTGGCWPRVIMKVPDAAMLPGSCRS